MVAEIRSCCWIRVQESVFSRPVRPNYGNPGLDYIDHSFAKWKLFVPDFNGDYFVDGKEVVRGGTYTLVNPGIKCLFGADVTGVSRPRLRGSTSFPGPVMVERP